MGFKGVIFILLCSLNQNGLSNFREVKQKTLQVGEDWLLPEKSDENLYLSRRGIASPVLVNQNQWKIVALKTGFTLLKTPTTDWKITVYRNKNSPSTLSGGIPKWLKHPGSIKTTLDPLTIEGTTDSVVVFHKAHLWCTKHPNCRIHLGLSKIGQKKLQDSFSGRIDDHILLTVYSNRLLFTLPSCTNSVQQTLIKRASHIYPSDLIDISCHTNKKYQLESRIIVTTSAEAKKIGSEFGSHLQFSTERGVEGKLFSKIQSLIDNSKAELIASPLLQVQLGHTGKSKSGGEIKVHEHQYENGPVQTLTSSWKNYGLEFEASPEAIQNNQVLVKFKLSVSQPRKSGASIISHGIHTTISLELGKETIAGKTNLSRSEDEGQKDRILSQIPFIGPLFKKTIDKQDLIEMVVAIAIHEIS